MHTNEFRKSRRTALLTAEQQEFAEVLGRLLGEEWDMRHQPNAAGSLLPKENHDDKAEKKCADE